MGPHTYINPLPSNKFLHMTKSKAFADDKLNVAKVTFSICDGKEENAGYQYFLPFPVFSQAFFLRVVKSRDCVVKS